MYLPPSLPNNLPPFPLSSFWVGMCLERVYRVHYSTSFLFPLTLKPGIRFTASVGVCETRRFLIKVGGMLCAWICRFFFFSGYKGYCGYHPFKVQTSYPEVWIHCTLDVKEKLVLVMTGEVSGIESTAHKYTILGIEYSPNVPAG